MAAQQRTGSTGGGSTGEQRSREHLHKHRAIRSLVPGDESAALLLRHDLHQADQRLQAGQAVLASHGHGSRPIHGSPVAI